MTRKVKFSLLSIIAATTLLGGSALAAFTTSATVTGNTFSTTNPALQISTDGGTTYGTSRAGFIEGGIVPGAAAVVHNFILWNSDTDSTATMTLNGQFGVLGGTLPGTDLNVRIACANGADVTLTAAQWNASAQGLGTLDPNATTACTMSASLPSGNTTDANKTITFDVVFGASVGL